MYGQGTSEPPEIKADQMTSEVFLFGNGFHISYVPWFIPDNVRYDFLIQVWDYIFLEGAPPKESSISTSKLEQMRREFQFWWVIRIFRGFS